MIVPGFTPELGTRITELYRLVGGQAVAADLVDSTSETLGKWKRGKARMPLYAAAALCEQAGKTLDWLVTGRESAVAAGLANDPARFQGGAPPSTVDEELLATVIEAVEEHLAERGITLRPDKKALLLSQLYMLILEEEGTGRTTDKELVARLVRLAS